MKIICFQLGDLQANSYLLFQGNDCILIDPADDASFLLEEIQRRNLKLQGMLATHGHFDHVMAVGEIQMSINVPLYIHKKDNFLIKRLGTTAKHFLGYEPVVIPPTNISFIKEGSLRIANYELRIIETPGHTPGGLSYYFPDEQVVFTGDTLFAGAVGRTDLSYSSKHDLWKSLKKLFNLPEETIVYSGHGEETIVGDENSMFGEK